MKTFRFALIGTIVLLGASSAFAQRVPAQPVQGRIGLFGDAPLLTPDAVEKLKFTNEQKDKYTKIDADYKAKAKAAQDAWRTALTGLRDREKFKEAQEKFQTDTKKAREDSLAKVEPILSAEQKTVFAQVKTQQPQPGGIGVRPGVPGIGIGGGIGQVLPPAVQTRLQLTDEQKKQIEAIQKDVEAKIMKVLNDEQKKQLDQLKKSPIRRPIPGQADQANPRVRPAAPNAQPAPAIKRD